MSDAVRHLQQARMRMAGPDVGLASAERVQVHHEAIVGQVRLGNLLGEEARAHQANLLVSKADEEKSVAALSRGECFVEGGQEHGARPIVDDALAGLYLVEVRPNNDGGGAGLAGQAADEVGKLGSFHALFGELRAAAGGFKELAHGLQPVRVGHGCAGDPLFERGAGD